MIIVANNITIITIIVQLTHYLSHYMVRIMEKVTFLSVILNQLTVSNNRISVRSNAISEAGTILNTFGFVLISSYGLSLIITSQAEMVPYRCR